MAGENRGFVLNAQRVVLDLDFAGSVRGTAYLTIKPTNVRLSTVYLHAAPCLRITSVHLSGPDIDDPLPVLPASFSHYNPLLGLRDVGEGTPINPTQPDSIQRHPEIKRKLWAAMAEKDEGELAVDVSHGWVRIAQAKQGGQPAQAGLAEILIAIDYEICMSDVDTEGIVWRRPGDAGNDYRIPHMFINSSSHDAARHWVPCLDSLWDRCPWELEISVPRYLKQESDELETEIEEGELVRVIASAELEEQVVHPDDPSRTLFYFVQSNPTSAQQMSFAAGPFHLHVVPEEDQTRRLLDSLDPTSDVQPLLLAYCLPGSELELANTVSCMRQAMSFLEGYDGYPYSSFKMVFVEDPSTQSSVSASLGTFSQEMLYPPEVVEQAFITRPILTHSLASQWSGVHMIPRSFSDIWLTTGLALYINAQLTRHLLGNNEYRFRLRSDMDRCVALDQGEQFPLHIPGLVSPPDAETMQFISLKAPLVLHMLDMRMARLATSSGLARNAIPDIFRQARGGTLQDRALSTDNFFRICRKISKSLDVIAFQEQWVTGSGCPKFIIGAQYNKKGQSITVSVFQGASQAWNMVSQKEPQNLDWKCPTKRFSGEVTLWVNEGDAAPYEHVVELGDEGLTHELVFTPHQRRAHRLRNGHYRQEKGLSVLQNMDDSVQASAALQEAAKVAEEWHFSGWQEPDAITFVEQGFDWIRYDPECEWLASIEVLAEVSAGNRSGLAPVMLPYYWSEQLQHDRDVIAQREAILNLARMPSGVAATALTKTALDETCFYRVRALAIEMLPRMMTPLETGEKLGIYHLVKILQTTCCTSIPGTESYQLQPPSQGQLAHYMVSQAVIRALSIWPWDLNSPRDAETSAWLRDMLTAVIEQGDSEDNTFSQSYYLASLISDLAALQKRVGFHLRQSVEYKRAAASIDRAMALDKVLPSYGNVITIAGLQAKFTLALTDKQVMPVHLPYFLTYTRIGNLPAVRRLAIDCILTCQLPSPWLYKYIRQLLKKEQSLSFRRHVAEGVANSWLMALALGEIEGLHQPSSRYIETDAERLAREQIEMDQDVPAWRRMLAKSPDTGRFLISQLIDTNVDSEMRIALLQAAETLTPGRREGAAAKLILKLGSGLKSKGKPNAKALPPAQVEATSPMQKRKPKGRQYRSGLSEEDFKAVNITLEKLLVHPRSDFFRHPVPDDENFAPGYYKIIKRPIDLSAIKHKLFDGQYGNRHQFKEDLDLIVFNCKTYNGEGSLVFDAAVEFEKVFTGQWARVEKTLSKKAQNGAEPLAVQPTALKFNVKRPSITLDVGRNGTETGDGARPPLSIRTKDYAPQTPGDKPKSAMKAGVKRQYKAQASEVDYDMLDALATSPPPTANQKKVKIAGPSKPLAVAPPKLKITNGETIPAITISKPVITLKRKHEVEPDRPERKPSPIAVPVSAQTTTIPNSMAGSALVNVKRLTERGWTQDRTPFKRVRAAKLLRDLGEKYKVLFWPRPDANLAPGYYDEIKRPMWIQLMEDKTARGQYQTLGELAADLEQIIWNCRKYNGVTSEPESLYAGPMEAQLLKTWPKLMQTDAIIPEERKLIDQWLTSTLKTVEGKWFQYPVDPVSMGIPDYFNIVKREEARDLTMIKTKIKNLAPLSSIDKDVILMVDNAVKYNGIDSPVGRGAKTIEAEYEKKRKQIFPHGSARESVENRASKRPRHE